MELKQVFMQHKTLEKRNSIEQHQLVQIRLKRIRNQTRKTLETMD